jgi:hypothetical protein
MESPCEHGSVHSVRDITNDRMEDDSGMTRTACLA